MKDIWIHITHILAWEAIEMPPSVSAFKGHTLLYGLFMDATQDHRFSRNSKEIFVVNTV
jgi:hypothetical protein